MSGIKELCRNIITLLMVVFLSLAAVAQSPGAPGGLKLWFMHPAASWNEALPVGNGRLGAMVFGGVKSERLQLNEKSVWTGSDTDFVNPNAKSSLAEIRKLLFAGKYAQAQKLAQATMMGDKKVWSTYQTLGDLELRFAGQEGEVVGYRRELDLETAVARVSYRVNNTLYNREVFASAPAQALLLRLTASRKGALNFDVLLNRPGGKARVSSSGNEIVLSEHIDGGKGVKLVARVRVLQEGGVLVEKEGRVAVEKADAVTLLLTAATDYAREDPVLVSAKHMEGAVKQEYDRLKEDHTRDYQHV